MSSVAAVHVDRSVVDSDYLFETVVCDVHSCAMQVGAIAIMLAAMTRPKTTARAHSCRHLLHDDAKIMTLALRYGPEVGIDRDLVTMLDRLYQNVGEAKRRVAPLLKPGAAAPKKELQRVCVQEWRRLAAEASVSVARLSELTQTRLHELYAEDAATLKQFLTEAAKAETERVDDAGVINLPTLRQRRQNARHKLAVPCTIALPTGSYPALLQNVSRDGLGIVCEAQLSDHQSVRVVFEDGRQLEAVVARRAGKNVGLALRSRLSGGDPLFGAARL